MQTSTLRHPEHLELLEGLLDWELTHGDTDPQDNLIVQDRFIDSARSPRPPHTIDELRRLVPPPPGLPASEAQWVYSAALALSHSLDRLRAELELELEEYILNPPCYGDPQPPLSPFAACNVSQGALLDELGVSIQIVDMLIFELQPLPSPDDYS